MRIKRTTAPDMRSAMQLIRAEQGPEAVILGNRQVAGGVEVISAVDYVPGAAAPSAAEAAGASPAPSPRPPPTPDSTPASTAPVAEVPVRAAVAPQSPPERRRFDAHDADHRAEAERAVRRATELLRAARAGRGAGAASGREPEAPAAAPRAEPLPEPLPEALPGAGPPPPRDDPAAGTALADAPAAGADARMAAMQRELTAMRELLAQQVNVMGWAQMTRRHPARVNLLTRLHQLGLGTALAREICLACDGEDPRSNWRSALRMLLARLPEQRGAVLDRDGVVAVLGPPGAGKSATVIKLAARHALRHGAQSVALVSADAQRLGAREQLRSMAAILDVPLHCCDGEAALGATLARLGQRRLVLVDTAGRPAADPALAGALAALRGAGPLRPLLVLSATDQRGALEATSAAFAAIEPVGCVITKVDESPSLGPVISAVARHQLPLAWLGTGQRVPEDLCRARAAGLLKRALEVAAAGLDGGPALLDTDVLASQFGRAPSHVAD